MEHYRLRKYRGPETWARVREAYVAGEPAASVCRRFDVTIANLRKKASREGWTRNRVAAETDLKPVRGAPDAPHPPPPSSPPPPPGPGVYVDPKGHSIDLATGVMTLSPARLPPSLALQKALIDAGRRLAEGKAAEASALLRAAETLAALTGAKMPTLDELDEADTGWDATDAMMRTIEARAAEMAGLLLSARDLPPSTLWHAHYVWRAAKLGPEVAAGDYARAVESGDAKRLALWDEEGRLKTLHVPSEEAFRAVASLVAMGRWFSVNGTMRGYLGDGAEGHP